MKLPEPVPIARRFPASRSVPRVPLSLHTFDGDPRGLPIPLELYPSATGRL